MDFLSLGKKKSPSLHLPENTNWISRERVLLSECQAYLVYLMANQIIDWMCGGHIWVWGRRKRSIWRHGCLQTNKKHWADRIILKKKSTGQGIPGNVWNAWNVSSLLSQGIIAEILLRGLHLFGRKRAEEGDAAFWASCGAFISRRVQFSVGISAGMKIGNKAYGYAFLEKVSFVPMNTVCNRFWPQPFPCVLCVFSKSCIFSCCFRWKGA